MNDQTRCPAKGLAAVLILLCLIPGSTLHAQYDTLRMDIAHVSGYPGDLVEIPIYISTEMSEADSCGGFDISIALSRPGLVFFEVDTTTVDTQISGDPPETTYVDIDTMFVCQFDTTGTLASGWDMVNCRSTIGKGLEMQLMGMADFMLEGNHAIPPNTSGVLLNIFGRIYSDVPDTLTDRIVNIEAAHQCYYSNTHGGLIEPAKNTAGSVTVLLCDCAYFCDLDQNGTYDPLDVSYIVNHVYLGQDARPTLPNCLGDNGDWNCDGGVDPLDVSWYVQYVYKLSGVDPCDPCTCAPYPGGCPVFP